MNEFDKMSVKRNEEKERKKKVILTGIAICIVLIIILAVMIIYYKKVDEKTFKLYINDVQSEFGEGFCITNDEGETYVRARDIASYIKWSYQNGEYGSYTEDQNSGYIQNEYEISSFVAGSNILKKYIQVTAVPHKNELGQQVEVYQTNSSDGTLETTTLDLPVISQNGQIYFPLKNLNDICNCNVNYQNPYRMYIYDQNFLIALAQTNAAQFGFQSISGIYENMRVLSYGMMVVSNGSLYGVVNLYNGSDVIGLKYTDMIFAQNVKEFFVKTNVNDEETVGIIDINGGIVVSPKNYSNIQILSDELGLYLVDKDGQYGVLNRKGDVIVHCEYDNIGIPENLLTMFDFSVEENKYLLFNDTIVVQSGDKYGIYDIEGNQNLATAFVGLGYIAEASGTSGGNKNVDRSPEDVLTIEIDGLQLKDGSTRDIKAIVVQQSINDTVMYGLYDSESKKLLLPCSCDRIYGKTSKGETEYYVEAQGQTYNLKEHLSDFPEYFE